MKGCNPTPNLAIKKQIAKRFKTVDVDEFRTCNLCKSELKR